MLFYILGKLVKTIEEELLKGVEISDISVDISPRSGLRLALACKQSGVLFVKMKNACPPPSSSSSQLNASASSETRQGTKRKLDDAS